MRRKGEIIYGFEVVCSRKLVELNDGEMPMHFGSFSSKLARTDMVAYKSLAADYYNTLSFEEKEFMRNYDSQFRQAIL